MIPCRRFVPVPLFRIERGAEASGRTPAVRKMNLDERMERHYFNGMRLASLICLAGAVGCAPCMAAAPPPQEQPAAEKTRQDAPRHVAVQSIAPVPGLPVPMDLTQADGIRLDALDLTVALKQHQAFLILSLIHISEPTRPY